jgi:hypothetical protein
MFPEIHLLSCHWFEHLVDVLLPQVVKLGDGVIRQKSNPFLGEEVLEISLLATGSLEGRNLCIHLQGCWLVML